ncbi:MAG: hypothetical protein H0X17_19680 [Deltaproteobacteria bacterium]|nr:hypothetical protein [Solirubrobacterales bacterium]MBA3821115.1 hypothetical protein [Deltaproteobacteria bacterium]
MRSEDSSNRLQRLRDLVARLEQLPGSEERDRVLSEVRARAVDLDTGETPRAMLPIDPEVLPPELTEPSPRANTPRKDLVATFRPRPARIAAAQAAPLVPPTAMPQVHVPLAIDERLSLEESPAPQSQAPRPWQLGLRG